MLNSRGGADSCDEMCLQIKLASVKLAMKYMKRVSGELEMAGGIPEEEELIVQGVKFAFRIHQVIDCFLFKFFYCIF